MVVVRIGRTVTTTTDLGFKPAAYGYVARPSVEPVYPVVVADVVGRGKYRLLLAGDGDGSAVFKVYVDGGGTPVDSESSDVSAIIEGVFSSGVRIVIDGSGYHSTFTYEVWTERDYVVGVSVS
jgi:hypothetical protein